MKVLPRGRVWTTVSELALSMKNGLYKPVEYYSDDGIACLRMYDIVHGAIIWKDIKRMNLDSSEIEEYCLTPGDLIVNRVNSRELVGKAAVFTKQFDECVFESKNIGVGFSIN